MPGRSASAERWGELALVVDTSAWSRAHLAPVRADFQHALRADRLRVSPIVRLEILYGARSGADFDALAERLAALRGIALTGAAVRAAQGAMRTLAHRSDGAQRIPIVDYLVAASAQEQAAAVLHYDRDYDRLAEVMEFESIWLAPPGSLD